MAFVVDVDEGDITRLKMILFENREPDSGLSSAFNAATAFALIR